jgi:hypothetical protein
MSTDYLRRSGRSSADAASARHAGSGTADSAMSIPIFGHFILSGVQLKANS